MLRTLTALVALSLVAGAAQAKPKEITAKDHAKYPALSGLNLSQEGDVLVGMVHEPGTNGMKQAVASWDLSGKIDVSKPLAPSYITPGNDRQRLAGVRAHKAGVVTVVGSQTWTGKDSFGCIREGRKTGSNATYISVQYMTDKTLRFKESDKAFEKARPSTVNGRDLCANIRGSGASIQDSLPFSPDEVVISRQQRGGLVLFKHNLKTGNETQMLRINGEWRPSLFDSREGIVLAQRNFEPVSGTLDYEQLTRIRVDGTDNFEVETPLTVNSKSRMNMIVLGRDDKTGKYFVATDKFRDKVAIYFYDAKTNQFDKEPVFAHPEYDAAGIIFGDRPDNFNEVLGFQYNAAYAESYFIDPETKSIKEGLEAAFPDQRVSITDYNSDMSRILFITYSDTQPLTYYLLVDKTKVAVIGNSRPWIKPEQLGKTELVTYTARDGLKVPAYVTMPAGWKKGDEPGPALIVPHGGPWVRDQQSARLDIGFVQYWANRGYTVMQPQYRGSTGWGRKHWLAGDNEWGQKMQDDKDDGAAWLVSQGYVDKDRIAMMGYSYGGYSSMAAAVRPNSPYQCAIAGAGVSNLTKLERLVSNNRFNRVFQGRTMTGLDPLQAAPNANIPIMVIHGDRDTRVPIFHGRDYYNAVKNHTDAKWVLQKDAPHGFPWPEHRSSWVKEIEDYLENDCGPGGI